MDGFICARIVRPGYIDKETGTPVYDESYWGAEIECKYQAVTDDNRGRYVGGEFKRQAYEITTEDTDFKATHILLKDSRGNDICEKDVQSLEFLEAIQKIKISI